MCRVRSVVGGYAIHCAVGQAGEQRFAIFARAQRRIHLVIGVVLAHVFIEQSEMVRRDLAGYAQMVALGLAYGTQSSSSRKMRNMIAAFGFSSEPDVAFDNCAFCFAGPSAQTKAESCWASVHHRALCYAAIFRVLNHKHVERCGSSERLAHDLVAQDRLAIVAQGDCACTLERSKISEALAHAANRGS